MTKKVTSEIADYISKDFEVLRMNGFKTEEAFKTIQSDVSDEFDVNVSRASVGDYAYKTYDEVKAKLKEHDRKYYQKIIKPTNERIEMIIDVFTGFDKSYTRREVWEIAGGSLIRVGGVLKGYFDVGVLNRKKIDRNFVYSLNPNSPLHVIADGFFKKRESKLVY